MNKAKHTATPTPWTVEENVKAGGVIHLAITNRAAGEDWMPASITPMHQVRPVDRANAEHICRCVNSHEALVSALRRLLRADEQLPSNAQAKEAVEAMSQARKALALAENQ